MNEQITIPADGIWILNRLQEHGYVGYAVGGCVRDALLHRTPHDWDFCTSATPEQIQACFSDVPCLTIGSMERLVFCGIIRYMRLPHFARKPPTMTIVIQMRYNLPIRCKQIYSGEILPSMQWHIIRKPES